MNAIESAYHNLRPYGVAAVQESKRFWMATCIKVGVVAVALAVLAIGAMPLAFG